MGNATWNYKNEVLKDTGHLTMNMALLQVDHWDLQHIEERTRDMIDKICLLYPYPDVKIAEVDEDVIDENEALEIALKSVDVNLTVIKKGSAYKSADGNEGYIFAASKMYPQGDKEKYWFGYREKRFEQLSECSNLNLVLICRHKNVVVVKLPKSFLDEKKERLNTSIDEDGNVAHYHIVIFVNKDSSVSMLLSHPELEEIDISQYVCK